MSISVKFTSHLDDIMKGIEKGDILGRRKASAYLARKMRKNVNGRGVSLPGEPPSRQTGTLRKSIGYIMAKKDRAFYVGVRASHAHLLEEGHEPNIVQSKRPFFKKTFKREKDKMISLISETWF